MTSTLDVLQTRYARLLAEHEATHSKLKHRVTRLEKKLVPPPPPTPETQTTKEEEEEKKQDDNEEEQEGEDKDV